MRQASARALVWRARIADLWANLWRWVLLAAGAALSAYFVLDRGMQNGVFTAGAIALLVIGAAVTSNKPMAIALMAMPALFIVERVGLGGLELSVSDVVLAAAFGTAVLLGTRPYSRPMRQLLWLNLFYQFATLFTVIVNPYIENTVEWFHAWLLVSGSLVVGWALGRAGYARLALLLIVGTSCVIAVGTLLTGLLQYASGNFSAVYPAIPLPMHKNFAGTAMAFAAVVAYVNPVVDLVVEELCAPRLLAAAARDRDDPVAPGAHRPHLRDRADRGSPRQRRTLALRAVPDHPGHLARRRRW